MLVKLLVKNYALIRELDVNLDKGLTIITGETGAGKSILLGALSLILGNRADTSVLLDKEEKCVVEGTFRIENYDLDDFFKRNDLDYEPVTILRREINPAGKSRAFINDSPVTVNLLKEIGEKLIDIHSQHQTLMLHDNAFQLDVVDSFGGNATLKNDYRSSYNKYLKIKKELAELKEKAGRNADDLEYYRFQFRQLEDAKLLPGEQQELEKEQELLSHAEEIKTGLSNSSGLLSSDESSVLSMLREVKANLARVREFMPDAESLFTRISSVWIELDDLVSEIDRMVSKIDADPGRLSIVNERLDLIYSLMQKHRVGGLDELIVKKGEIENILKSIENSDERIASLEKLLENEEKNIAVLADSMSLNRKKIVIETEKRIIDLLRQLGMPNARFSIALSSFREFTAHGRDQVDFLFSANRQVPPENLAKIASGGELSRVMLCLKSLLSKNNNLPTIIFDEIDSGVSGEVADKVGQILSGMGKYMQVVNITHLPQVASRGNRHFHVYKDETGDSTITRIRLLSMDERVLEVARMLSGREVTETSIENARELLQAAQN
jgi:DNA repair protein RecN (Recombination protein N)